MGVVVDGEALVELVNQVQPDAIVSDVGLRGLNGMLATVRIRRKLPKVPIVLITADYDPVLRPTALAAGASAFLSKIEAEGVLVDLLLQLLLLDNAR